MRKAETLRSLNELSLSNRTLNKLNCMGGNTLKEKIHYARICAIESERHPEAYNPRWVKEFISALRKAGFIRDDFTRTYSVLTLYCEIIGESWSILVPKLYEDAPPVTDLEFTAIVNLIFNLKARECMAIMLNYGLYDGRAYKISEIADRLCIKPGRVRPIIKKGLRKLGEPERKAKLPTLFGLDIGTPKPTLDERLNALFA